MAHELRPPEGAPFLSVDDVVARWRGAFAVVEADRAAGAASLDEQIAHMARTGGPFTRDVIERARRNRDRAVRVRLADSPQPGAAYLDTVLEPDGEIRFDYDDAKHARAAAPLVARAARALGYEVERV